MKLPNEKLLSAVLEEKILCPFWDDTEDSKLWFISSCGNQFINIYELMHLMKKWALEQGFYIKSQLGIEKSVANIFNIRFQDCDESFFADTEIEAVEKACEWILNARQL